MCEFAISLYFGGFSLMHVYVVCVCLCVSVSVFLIEHPRCALLSCVCVLTNHTRCARVCVALYSSNEHVWIIHHLCVCACGRGRLSHK